MKKIKISILLSVCLMLIAGIAKAQFSTNITLTINTSMYMLHPATVSANLVQVVSSSPMDANQFRTFILDGNSNTFSISHPSTYYNLNFTIGTKTNTFRNLPTATSGPVTYLAPELDFPTYGYGITVYYLGGSAYSFTVTELQKLN